MQRIKYKYLFRLDGGEIILVPHETRPGDAEICARKLAKLVGKREGAAEVMCVWFGPEFEKIPEAVLEETRRSAEPSSSTTASVRRRSAEPSSSTTASVRRKEEAS